VLAGKERGLVFRRYAIGDDLALNRFGIEEPIDTAPIVKPDFLLVPMLAFDRQCYRLGYGGGYYDRTIKELRQNRGIMAIGLAFSFQEVRESP
ncbi:5-formyltetrahydrofolate cyclo-ligase, partial [Acinetobacter baumannii]